MANKKVEIIVRDPEVEKEIKIKIDADLDANTMDLSVNFGEEGTKGHKGLYVQIFRMIFEMLNEQ